MIKCENRAMEHFRGYTPVDTYAVTPIFSVPFSLRPFFA